MTERPLVHVVVVDYDGGELTLACLRSLLATDWPSDRLHVVLVDNASRRPVVDEVAAALPTVEVVRSAVNRGFAGGVNLGLRTRADADFVAIVNNDATVDRGWLEPLVAALEADPRVGAGCPKILLASPAVELDLAVATHQAGRGDHRPLGVRVSGVRVAGADCWARTQLVEGFWGAEPMPADEPTGQWTDGTARLRLPVPVDGSAPTVAALRLAADTPTDLTVASGDRTTTVAVGTTPEWFDVELGAAPVEVINNVGTNVAPDGYGSDRGWLEVDRGQYDEPADVAAWCGAGVLLSRAYLDDVGMLDERLFLYYEDVEMSLRGAARGWRYRTVPESIVRHVHSATSVEGSPLSTYYNERNRLLVYASRAPLGAVAKVFARYGAVTASYAMRDITSRALRGKRPRPEIVTRRVRALAAAAVRLPGMRRSGSHPGPASPRH